MTVVWSMKEFKEELPNWSNNYSVTLTLKDEKPGTILMKFVKGEDGCQD